jgi:hypothetical protein
MVSVAASTFGQSYRAMLKFAETNPDWMDRARDLLARKDQEHLVLLHAIAEALKVTHEAGAAGKMVPLKYVQSQVELEAMNSPARVPQQKPQQKPAPRVARTAPPQQIVQDPYLEGIANRDKVVSKVAIPKRVVRSR